MKPLVRRALCLGLAVSLALPLGGCLGAAIRQTGPLGFILFVFVGATPQKARQKVKLKDKSDVEYSGQIGGLDGSYDVSLGEYGSVSGVADIKGQFKAKIKLKEQDEELASVVEAVALDRFGVAIDVTSTKGSFKGRQTRGGVKKIFKSIVKFEGVVASGENAGSVVKGKLTLKDKFE